MVPLVDHVFHMEDGNLTDGDGMPTGGFAHEFNGHKHGEVSRGLPSLP